jgi:hypothetical protein
METLLIVAGAGASIRSGIPSTPDLTHLVRTRLGLENGTADNAVLALEAFLTTRFGAEHDFELIIHAIEQLQTFTAARNNDLMLQRFRPVIESLADLRAPLADISEHALRRVHAQLLHAIAECVGTHCDDPQGGEVTANRARFAAFIERLAHRFRLVVVDLNYDTLFDSMAIGWRDGFDRRLPFFLDAATRTGARECSAFEPQRWFAAEADKNAHLLMHLHGSVRFGTAPLEVMPRAETVRFDDRVAALESLMRIETWGHPIDGQDFGGYPIISGLQKGGKMIYNPRPYGCYFGTAMREFSETTRLLVIGYGWRDAHLNTWIHEFARRSDRRHVAVATRRSGASIYLHPSQDPQAEFLPLLAGADWPPMASFVFERNDWYPDVATFSRGMNFALMPGGLPLSDNDEAELEMFFGEE